jgi:DHA2 family multidrug resistance protein-like MFS transporter
MTATSSSLGAPAPLTGAKMALAIAGVVLAVFLPTVDGVIVQIALPSIGRTLNASRADTVWVVNAYNVAILMTLLPAAGLADRFGYRRVARAGVVIFALSSAACAVSPTLPLLALSRAVQGIGAAGIMSCTQALMRQAYGPARLPRAMAAHSMTVALGTAAGPSLAAAILLFGPWPMLFLINLPAGMFALIASRALPAGHGSGHRFDVLSAGLSAVLLGLLTLSGAQGQQGRAVAAIAVLAVAVAVGGWLYARSRHAHRPLLPVDLLRGRVFSLSMLGSICVFAAQSIAMIALPFMLQQAGRSPSQAGLMITAWPVCVVLSAFTAGRIGEGRAARTAVAGAGLFGIALVSLALAPQAASTGDMIWRIALCGLGFGLFQTPNNTLIFGSAPADRGGAAGGMLALARLTGQTVGAMALGALIARLGVHPWPTALAMAAAACALAVAVGSLRAQARAAARNCVSAPDDALSSASGTSPASSSPTLGRT